MKLQKSKALLLIVIFALIGIEYLYSISNFSCSNAKIEPFTTYNITEKADLKDTKKVNITKFEGKIIEKIKVGFIFNVSIIKTENKKENRVVLSASEDIMNNIDVSLSNGELRAYSKNHSKNYKNYSENSVNIDFNRDECSLIIYTDKFQEINGSGAAVIAVDDNFDYAMLSLKTTGASSINFKNEVSVDKRLNLSCSGASNIKFSKLTVVEGYDIILSGASKVLVRSGKCISLDNNLKCSGASVYVAENFVSNGLDVQLSGATSAKVNVLDILDISSSGASNLKYKANNSVRISGEEGKYKRVSSY